MLSDAWHGDLFTATYAHGWSVYVARNRCFAVIINTGEDNYLTADAVEASWCWPT